jgi:hypothetical protein
MEVWESNKHVIIEFRLSKKSYNKIKKEYEKKEMDLDGLMFDAVRDWLNEYGLEICDKGEYGDGETYKKINSVNDEEKFKK